MTAPPTVLVGPSRFLPPPLDRLSQVAWDLSSFHGRRLARAVPVAIAQSVAWSVERAQRPTLPLFHATDGAVRVAYRGNDPALRDVVGGLLVPGGVFSPADRTVDADVSITEIPTFAARRYAGEGFLVLPHFVEFEVDLERPESERFGTRRRETVRRIEKAGLVLEEAHGDEAARFFYETMFAPTARARHGEHAIVRRFAYVAEAIRRGALLFVREDGERLAGIVVVPRLGAPDAVDAWLIGVRGGAYEQSTVAREAAYLLSMRWAREARRASRFGLTTAPPFLSHGLSRYKASWGPAIRPGLRSATALAVRATRATPELAARLVAAGPCLADFRTGDAALHVPSAEDLGGADDLAASRLRELALALSGARGATAASSPRIA
ncbi:MAG TPA: hypothetical protein VHE30_15505 [Polyangiaceae bacterium]|nr:hypothetical protein [Polyangiaceae bacterium]